MPAAIAAALTLLAGSMLLAQGAMKPTPPGTQGDPQWQGVVRLSDGRQFLTDGGLAIDVAVAKPATLPAKQLAGKVLESYMTAPHPDVAGFDDLVADGAGRTYRTPKGLPLNATYIDYLRRIVPARGVRLHMKGDMDPVTVSVDDKVIAVLMPVRK